MKWDWLPSIGDFCSVSYAGHGEKRENLGRLLKSIKLQWRTWKLATHREHYASDRPCNLLSRGFKIPCNWTSLCHPWEGVLSEIMGYLVILHEGSLPLSLARCMPHYACLGDLCGRITFSFYSRDWCFPLQEEAYTTSCSLCPDSPTASGYGFPACIRWLLGGGSNNVLGFFLPLCYLQKVYKSLGLIFSFFYISPSSLSCVHVSCTLVFLSV